MIRGVAGDLLLFHTEWNFVEFPLHFLFLRSRPFFLVLSLGVQFRACPHKDRPNFCLLRNGQFKPPLWDGPPPPHGIFLEMVDNQLLNLMEFSHRQDPIQCTLSSRGPLPPPPPYCMSAPGSPPSARSCYFYAQ